VVRGRRIGGTIGGMAASVALGALAFVALPTAGLALESLRDVSVGTVAGDVTFTPATVDPRVAELVGEGATSRMLRFTPAGLAERPNRSVTVAVRVDQDTARAIQVRSAIAAAQDQVAGNPATLRIAPTRYNLGMARVAIVTGGTRGIGEAISLPCPEGPWSYRRRQLRRQRGEGQGLHRRDRYPRL
jgi:hypothetical protein